MEKDWKKEAWQAHIAFHQTVLDMCPTSKIADEEVRKGVEKAIGQAHNLFDTSILWLEKLNDECLKLKGALEESRRK